eukprot:TRINITY_DN16121_c0_g2_i1.p1 TRINITY_DN16121_c0_g2~~TRINITY_DN16121_c0_g2_i1.p1  ORF type:complete len:443 (-),score=98.00 TRINITY_DN16121_c0_g2_i1:57-1385(-)
MAEEKSLPSSLSAAVLVVGDVGRSPRMQYHARSLLSHCRHVSIIGMQGSPPLQELRDAASQRQASFHWLPEFGIPKPKNKLLYIPFAITKAIFGFIELFAILLFAVPDFDVLIVQNPPSIPTLFVCLLVTTMRGVKLVIDWHNYGWSILGHSLGSNSHIFVKFAKWYEKAFGAHADANLCVTKAMKDDLKANWKIDAEVLYDRPPSFFKRASPERTKELFEKLFDGGKFESISDFVSLSDINSNERPAIVISSTSYTQDEDFEILLDAVKKFDEAEPKSRLLVIVTGKGPLKDFYGGKIAALNPTLKRTRILQLWMDIEDYPVILGSADLGVSLHVSTSGRDLPMKVVDMFGCGVPVCALQFPCLSELVVHGENGYCFRTASELADQLISLLANFPRKTDALDNLAKGVSNSSAHKVRWDENWDRIVLPLLHSSLSQKQKQR